MSTQFQHGDGQHGDDQHGGGFSQFIANSLDQEQDANFSEGSNLRSTFFIGGATPGLFANVDSEREKEFRQLVLRVKPVQTVAYLFINYV